MFIDKIQNSYHSMHKKVINNGIGYFLSYMVYGDTEFLLRAEEYFILARAAQLGMNDLANNKLMIFADSLVSKLTRDN